MNLADLSGAFADAPDTTPLVFVTDEGEIGAGYHLTELKFAQITGIDCAARVTEWTEATVQLLDGDGRSHMQLGKFRSILRQSVTTIPGLKDAPLKVEFAHGNEGMRTYEMEMPDVQPDCAMIRLRDSRAMCKPAFAWSGVRGVAKANADEVRSGGCCT